MDTAKLNLIVDLYEKDSEWSLSGRLRELKNKGKAQLSNPKSGCGRLRYFLITRLSHSKKRFHKGGRKGSFDYIGSLTHFLKHFFQKLNIVEAAHLIWCTPSFGTLW